LLPLYHAVVARARDPFWYRDAQVPDTVDGRFDMLAATMALVVIRFEAEPGEQARHDMVMLTELFIEDMDESLHQIGIGDYVVGKHVGRMMGALGGRLTAFRQAAQERDFTGAVLRNIFHESPPSPESVERVASRLERFDAALLATPAAAIAAGSLPPL
jgi:cytochrome b pre-mRNA-processing protein 3